MNHLEYLTTVKKLNLQNNNLRNLNFLTILPCLESIDLSGNKDLSKTDKLVDQLQSKIEMIF